MNRLSFLRKFSALVGCFWVAPHITSQPASDKPLMTVEDFRRLHPDPPCPRCNGTGKIGNMEFGHRADGIIPDFPPYAETPCPVCAMTKKEQVRYFVQKAIDNHLEREQCLNTTRG